MASSFKRNTTVICRVTFTNKRFHSSNIFHRQMRNIRTQTICSTWKFLTAYQNSAQPMPLIFQKSLTLLRTICIKPLRCRPCHPHVVINPSSITRGNDVKTHPALAEFNGFLAIFILLTRFDPAQPRQRRSVIAQDIIYASARLKMTTHSVDRIFLERLRGRNPIISITDFYLAKLHLEHRNRDLVSWRSDQKIYKILSPNKNKHQTNYSRDSINNFILEIHFHCPGKLPNR